MNQGVLRGLTPGPGLSDVKVYIARPGFYVATAATTGWDEFSYDIPSWARLLYVRCIGSGGGGGSGSVEPAATAAWGGGGGGAASVGEAWLPTVLLPSRLWIYAPWGGVGGAAVATTGTSGNNGGDGLGAYVTSDYETMGAVNIGARSLVLGNGGAHGGGGTTSAAGAGAAGTTTVWAGAAGGNSSAGLGSGSNNAVWTAGGGGGAGMAATHASTAGGGGTYPTALGTLRTAPTGGAAGVITNKGQDGWLVSGNFTSNTGAIQPMLRDYLANLGGGGAGGNSVLTTTVNAGAGGNGAIGCGGGGGGSKENDTTYASGAGGNGGPGMILIVALG